MTAVADLTVGDIGRRVRVTQGESVLVGPLCSISAEAFRISNGLDRYVYSISLQVGQFDVTAGRDTPLDFLEEDE